MRNWRLRLWSKAIARSKKPILIGPWRSEIGFESLYWLPWLTAWRAKYKIPKERLIAVSRGGAGHWYDAQHAVDLYDYAPLDRLRKAMLHDSKATGSIKQQGQSAWETQLLRLIAHDLGLTSYHVLHPSLMYRGLAGWWEGTTGWADLLTQLTFGPIPVPQPPLAMPLPDQFVAVRFYHRHTWPMTDQLKTWVANEVDAIAKRVPVVVLDSGLHADDHIDFPLEGQNILHLAPYVTPQNNLAMQSAVLAKANAFVGTYGGTMQLAVRLGKPAAGFFHKFEGTAYAHKALTEWLGVQTGQPVFIGTPESARFAKEVALV